MPARTEFDRLAAARPALLARTEDVVDAAEVDRILRQIVSSRNAAPGSVLPRPGTRQRTPRLAAAGAIALTLAIVGVLALIQLSGVPARPPVQEASRPAETTPRAGPVIRLAGYSLTLPAGFAIVAHPCAPGPAQRTGLFAAAGSATGGCLEAFLEAGHSAEIPANSQAVRVGPYRAFAVRGTRSSVRLYVKLPVLVGERTLVLVAHRLSLSQIVAIATAGLPAKISPRSPCTNGCG